MSQRFDKRKWAETLFLSGFCLVCFVFLNIFITSALLIVKVSALAATPIVSFVLAEGITLLLAKKQGLLPCGWEKGVAAAVPVVLIVCSVVLSMLLIDRSYDGNYYHKAAIGGLANDWNPLYEGLMEFSQRASLPVPVSGDDCLWADHYAKASYFFAAPMYVLTGSIEAGKSINLISMFALFLLWCGYLLHKDKHPLFVLLVGGVIVSCPIFGAQMFTNYIDLLVGIYLFIIILVFFVFEEEAFIGRNAIAQLLLFMGLCIMINIKFSSFGYAGLFCLGYYVWYLYRTWKKELAVRELVRLTVTAAAAVAVGVLVIGLSVYVKNFLDHGHPFYPLFGDGKMDIMGINQPACFEGMSAVEKFFRATFSRAANIYASFGGDPELKLPFMVTGGELGVLHSVDLRISGFGVFFSGILIVSALLWLWLAKEVFKTNRKLFLLTAFPLGITLVMIPCFGESWWARYFPQLYLLPVFVLLYLDACKGKAKQIAAALLIVLLLLNNGLTFGASALVSLIRTAEVNEQFTAAEAAAEQTNGTIVLKAGPIRGALYNAVDRFDDRPMYVVISEDDEIGVLATEPAYIDFVYWGISNE